MRQTKKWTDEDRTLVAEMLRNKATAMQIAAAFGVGKNCIIGVVHRDKSLKAIGFNWRIAHPIGNRAPRRKRTGAPAQRIKLSRIPGVLSALKQPRPRQFMPQKQSLFGMMVRSEPRPPLPIAIPTAFECRSVPLMDLRAGDCKWPVNNAAVGELHLFCGNPASGSYCPGHAFRSVGYGTPSERKAVHELKRYAKLEAA